MAGNAAPHSNRIGRVSSERDRKPARILMGNYMSMNVVMFVCLHVSLVENLFV